MKAERLVMNAQPADVQPSDARIQAVLEDLANRGEMRHPLVEAEEGRLLKILVQSLGAKNVLEVGAWIGYTALWMGWGLAGTGGKLTTVQCDRGLAHAAEEAFRRAGMQDRVTLAKDGLARTLARLQEPLDFVFIDGTKNDYLDYFKQVMPRVRVGGIIAAHDVATITETLRDYIDAVRIHPGLDSILTLAHTEPARQIRFGGQGIALSRKKDDAADGFDFLAEYYQKEDVSAAGFPTEFVPPYVWTDILVEDYQDGPNVFVTTDRLLDRAWLRGMAGRLVREFRERYGEWASGRIYIFDDRMAFEHRNDLKFPAERYLRGNVGRIYINPGSVEDRCRVYLLKKI